jgi:Na+-transporting NADH:ubiquinone oxidoreductase subunit NqrD
LTKRLKEKITKKIQTPCFRTSYLTQIINNKTLTMWEFEYHLRKRIATATDLLIYNNALCNTFYLHASKLCGINALLDGTCSDLSYSSFIMCSSLISSCFGDFLLGCAILLYYLSVNSCFNLSQRGYILLYFLYFLLL